MATTNQQKFLNQTPIQQGLIGNFHTRFIRVASDIQPKSILELGCGEGYLLSQLHQHFPSVPMLGLDNLDVALDEGHRIFPELQLMHGDIYHIAQPDKSWDLVIASEVLEHLDDPLAALKELKRVSSRHVLLSVPHEPWFRLGNLARGRHLSRLGNHPEHVNLWSRSGFAKFVGQELQVDRVIGAAFPWTIVLAHV